MTQHQNIAPANVAPTPQDIEMTGARFDDRSMNVSYARLGDTVPLDVEQFGTINGSPIQQPYYLIGESGTRYYFSPDREGVGVMLIDRNPEDRSPDKRVQWKLLNGMPPKDVRLGQPCTVPGLGLDSPKEPIRRVVMLHSESARGYSATDHEGLPDSFRELPIPRQENPIIKMEAKFDAAVSSARSLGRLAQVY